MRATLTHDLARSASSASSAFPSARRRRNNVSFRARSRRFAGKSLQHGRYYWAATDHLGSVTELLDGTESIVEHREYDSFGALDAAYNEMGSPVSAGNLKSNVGFTGKFFDTATGLQYNSARWYDPTTGRYLSEDPIQDGSNWYQYAKNNPILYVDPTGFAAQGNPLNNLYSGLGSLGPSYSAQQLFGGPVSNNRTSANPINSIYNLGPSYNPVNTGYQSPKTSGGNRGGGSPSTASLINSFSSPTNIDYTYYGPATNANSLNRTDPLYNYTPSREITGIRSIGGDSLGDMVLGSAASSLNRSINTTTSPGAAFAGQLASPFVNAAKGVLDVIGPRSEPSYERRYSDGSRDFYLNGEPATGDLLNQGLALLRGVPLARPMSSQARIQEANKQLNILNPDFTPSGRQVLQNLTNRENAKFIANPRKALEVLEPDEFIASAYSPQMARIHYGNAVHRLVGREINDDPLGLGSIFDYNPHKGPDISGKGHLGGQFFDITTPAQIPAHLARPYGATLQIITYERPAGFPF